MSVPKLAQAERRALRAMLDRIQLRLRALDMSGNELARQLESSQGMVSEWFTKDRVPLVSKIIPLSTVLDCSLHWLLTGEGPMARPDGPAMSADEAAVRTGLAVLARIDLTMNAVRGDLLQQLERLSGSRPGHAVAATRAVAGARSDGKGKKKGRRTHTG